MEALEAAVRQGVEAPTVSEANAAVFKAASSAVQLLRNSADASATASAVVALLQAWLDRCFEQPRLVELLLRMALTAWQKLSVNAPRSHPFARLLVQRLVPHCRAIMRAESDKRRLHTLLSAFPALFPPRPPSPVRLSSSLAPESPHGGVQSAPVERDSSSVSRDT